MQHAIEHACSLPLSMCQVSAEPKPMLRDFAHLENVGSSSPSSTAAAPATATPQHGYPVTILWGPWNPKWEDFVCGTAPLQKVRLRAQVPSVGSDDFACMWGPDDEADLVLLNIRRAQFCAAVAGLARQHGPHHIAPMIIGGGLALSRVALTPA